MKTSAVLRKAARNIHAGIGSNYSCCQIKEVVNNGAMYPDERIYYTALMNDSVNDYAMIDQFDPEHRARGYVPEEIKNLRVMTLLMAAAVAESEGD